MCLARAEIRGDGDEGPVMTEIVAIETVEKGLRLRDLYGTEKEIPGARILTVDFGKGLVVLGRDQGGPS